MADDAGTVVGNMAGGPGEQRAAAHVAKPWILRVQDQREPLPRWFSLAGDMTSGVGTFLEDRGRALGFFSQADAEAFAKRFLRHVAWKAEQ